jgi:cyclophilin family peptidyl-prolyl cis-trans isomerase
MQEEVYEAEVLDESLAPIGGSALAVLTKAEVDIAISTAKRWPRSVQRFKAEAISMATVDEETAASCFYTLKRKNQNGDQTVIQGESIRLAEICAVSWGNIRHASRVIEVGDTFIVAQGIAHDLQTNNYASREVRRRITTRECGVRHRGA